ncbi:glycosyltransferase family 2 protein [Patescibacteria group bacterium]|nr:glycosyltransferase family 2 protein [Patescibacteria group bacterium]MBU4580354.1 glycosyltransferase family 2 protein [Patescibacteria group bacterium]
MKFSIIIATLNEEAGIAKAINSIPKEIRSQAEIIVSDVSTDSTPQIAEKLRARVIKMKEKGKGRQMREAVKQSKGEILIFMDGDATDPGEYIPKLIKKMEETNANIALACRSGEDFKEDNKMAKRAYWLYAIFCLPLFWLIGMKVADPLAGFRAISRKDWDLLDLKSDYFEIESEMNVKAIKKNFIIREIHIPHMKRADGITESKLFADPVMWLKIVWTVLKFFKAEK